MAERQRGDLTLGERIAEALELNRKIIDNAAAGIVVVDRDGDCVQANRWAAKTVGIPVAELLGQNVLEQECWRASGLRTAMLAVLEDGGQRRTVANIRSASDKRVHLDCSLTRFTMGGSPHVLLLFEDVTPFLEAEARLRRQQRLMAAVNRVLMECLECPTEEDVAKVCLQHAVEITGSSFGLIAARGAADNLEVLAISDAAWDASRMPRVDAIQLLQSLSLGGLFGKVALRGETVRVAATTGNSLSPAAPDGHPEIGAFLAVPLLSDGKPAGLIGLANRPEGYSASEQEDMETLSVALSTALAHKRTAVQRQRAMAELTRSNEDLEQFAYVASHDLQEPLRKIRLFGGRLRGACDERLPPEGRDYLERMDGAVERMQRLVDGLLEYARVSVTRRARESVDLNGVLQEVLADLQVRLEECGGTVSIAPLPTLEADRLQMVQLFCNLVDNALKYRHPERAPQVRIRAEQTGDGVVVSVSDNGIGMAPEQQERVFELFRRLHGSGEFSGTGIGLSMVRKIVERHGGSVSVEGAPGEGCTFRVTLPVRPREERDEQAGTGDHHPHGRG